MNGFRPVPGTKVMLDDTTYTVARYDQVLGSVHLDDVAGVRTVMGIEEILNHRGLRLPTSAPKPSLGLTDRITKRDLDRTHARIAHLLEVETGYRSGSSDEPLPGEPRSEYDLASTTLTQRRRTKAAELDNDFAKAAGLSMSYTTLRRWGDALRSGGGIEAVIDKRHIRRRNGRHSISAEVEEALLIVDERTKNESNLSMRARYTLVKQYMFEHYDEDGTNAVPSRQTISRWFHDRHIPSELKGKARTRASATTAPATGFVNPNPTRPGELVLMDTNSLDVLLEGTIFEGQVSGSLVLGLDWYSRSVASVRVVENAEAAIDVSFAIRDMAKPKPMLPGWPDDARWPFIGVPDSLLTDVNGRQASGLPIVNPEALVVDHGPTYKSHISRDTARRYGVSILPARKFKPSDKAPIERFFRSLASMLLQYLRGYRGSDPSERGKDTDTSVTWTAQQIEDLISLWAVRIWQTHIMDGVRPPWCPEGDWSPNALYQHGISTSGLPPRMLTSDDYYGLLPTRLVKIQSRGVKVRGLYYDAPEALADLRNVPSPHGGLYKGKWVVRFDERDMREVFLLGPDEKYVTLRWSGATGAMPCFTDRHVTALSRIRRERGLRPQHDCELTDILIKEILTPFEPTANWSKPKKGRAAQSRVARNEELKTRDQASVGATTPPETAESATRETHTEAANAALDQAKARRRARTDAAAVTPATRLGVQRSGMFGDLAALIPEEGEI